MKENQLKYQIISDFLRRIHEEGYPLGTGVHLRTQDLISRLPDNIPPEKLHQYITPIFARSEDEQVRFKKHFHDAVELSRQIDPEKIEPTLEEPSIKEKKDWTRFLWWLIPILLLPIAFAILYLNQPKPIIDEPPAPTYVPYVHSFIVEEGNTEYICFDTLPNFGPVIEKSHTDSIYKDSLKYGHFLFDSTRCLTYTAFKNVERDTVQEDTIFGHWVNDQNHKIWVKYVATISPKNINPEPPDSTEPPTGIGPPIFPYKKKKIPYNESHTRLIPPALSHGEKFFIRHFNKILLASIILGLVLLLLLIWETFFNRKKDSIVARQEPKNLPPYLWNISLDNPDIDWDDDVELSIRQLRERARDDGQRLDIGYTIKKTIKQGGRFNPQFKGTTRPPEYLFLIERRSPNDHRTLLYDTLFQTLRENEIFASRYFFNMDIRVCYNEEYRNGIKLIELTKKYMDARLIIMGTGSYLLHPRTGKLSKWTNIFDTWKERAIMTPKTLDTWNRQENRLEEKFTVMPFGHLPLAHWVYVLKNDLDWNSKRWKKLLPSAQTHNIKIEGNVAKSLRPYFHDSVFIWLAACAVYPTLNWDLTLHIGHFLEKELNEEELVSIHHLSALFRLDWFSDGKIPPEHRADLIAFLQKEHPVLLEKIRLDLIQIFEKQPPPIHSAAHDEHQMNLLLNQWSVENNSGKKKELQKEIEQFLFDEVEGDFVMLKKISEEQRSELDFEVPKSWNKFINDDEDAIERALHGNHKKGLRLIFLICLFFLNTLLFIYLPTLLMGIGSRCTTCNGDPGFDTSKNPISENAKMVKSCKKIKKINVNYDSVKMCIKNDEDYLLHVNHQSLHYVYQIRNIATDTTPLEILNNLQQYNPDKIIDYNDTLVDNAKKVHKNIAIAYYNKAIDAYLDTIINLEPSINANQQTSINEPVFLPLDSTATTCKYIKKAYQYDTTDVDIVRLAKECDFVDKRITSFEGKVLDANTETPIPYAKLIFSDASPTLTNGYGIYAIIDMGDIFDVAVFRPWYEDKIIPYNELKTGNQLKDIKLLPKKFIGQIRDQNNRPIPNMNIYNAPYDIDLITDENGNFTITPSPIFPDESLSLDLLLEGYERTSIRIFPEEDKNPKNNIFIVEASPMVHAPQPMVVQNDNNAPTTTFTNGGKKGIKKGAQIILNPLYDDITGCSTENKENYYILQKGKKYYLFSERHSLAGPFDELKKIKNGFAVFKQNNQYSYLNISGAQLNKRFDWAKDFNTKGEADVGYFYSDRSINKFTINKNGECASNCLPDLFIANFKMDKTIPTKSEKINFEVTLKNAGANIAQEIPVEWWASTSAPKPAYQNIIKQLKPGQEKTLTFSFDGYPSWYGKITSEFIVDPRNRIKEKNKKNNTLKKTYEVKMRDPYMSYISLGDQALNKKDYVSAKNYYEKAKEIKDTPGIRDKIMVVEELIQKGKAQFNSRESFFEYFAPLAMEEMKKENGIPASITLGIAALESNWGQSELAKKANNYFNLKCGTNTSRCYTRQEGKNQFFDIEIQKPTEFMRFDNPKACFRYHTQFIMRRDNYLKKLDKSNYQVWAEGLQQTKYSTASNYAEKLIAIIEQYNLDQYDKRVSQPTYNK